MKEGRAVRLHEEEQEEEEPPLLGDNELDNQHEDHPSRSQSPPTDRSLMDEMLAAGVRARNEKQRVAERERNRKAFGDGLKKGFFNSAPAKKPAAKPRAKTREEQLTIVKPPTTSEESASSSFMFPEVQAAMQAANQLDPKQWMNDRFFEKLAKNPKLAQALRNPAFSQAITDMQQDPNAAVAKYQKDRAVSTMLRDFMEFLGGHFEEMGNQQQSEQRQDQEKQHKPTTTSAPAIEDLDAKRRAAIASMPRSAEEEAQVQRILDDPELLRVLSDGALMERLKRCQGSPGGLQKLLADPQVGPKIRLLAQHNLVRFAT